MSETKKPQEPGAVGPLSLSAGLGKLSDAQFAILQAKETMEALIGYEKQYASGANVKAIHERIIGFADFIKARLSEMSAA